MTFLSIEEVAPRIAGRSVAVVGSGPTVLKNEPGVIDGHDVVVRVNNYKLTPQTGARTDVFYSFFGRSVRKTREDLRRDGVKLCWSKCPNSKPIQCDWHEKNGKQNGIDYRYIFEDRQGWWPCDVVAPTDEEFLRGFNILGRHVPTTGFAAFLDVLACDPRAIYLTGFDFFSSKVHNVNEPWRPGRPDDPIGHVPDLERAWLKANLSAYPISLDARLQELLA